LQGELKRLKAEQA